MRIPYRVAVALSIVGAILLAYISTHFGLYHALILVLGLGIIAWFLPHFIPPKTWVKPLEQVLVKEHNAVAESTSQESAEEYKARLQRTLRSLRHAQQQLMAQEQMASIGMLTAGIAHEIKNPLNFINNFSDTTVEMLEELKEELAKLNVLSDDNNSQINEIMNDIEMNCKKINEHGKRAESIIKNMLIQSRTTGSEKVITNVNILLEEYLNLAYHGMRAHNSNFNVKIEKALEPNLEKITICQQNMGRVFLNIINNGLYALNKKQKRLEEINEETNYMPTIRVSTEQDEKSVIVKIWDNGDGIPEDLRNKIFEPFFTTKPAGEGTGLGLSLCADIVKEHNGKLEIETQDQEFTQFIITLPKDNNK